MINDSRGTSADTMMREPGVLVSAEARTPFPTASVSERGGHAGEDVVDNEKCVGGSRVAGPAVGTPSASSSGNADNPVGMMATRIYHAWTDDERAKVIATYDASGPAAAIRVGKRFGATRNAVLTMLYEHRSSNGLPKWSDMRRGDLIDALAERGSASTRELAEATKFSLEGVRRVARDLGWVKTTRRPAGRTGGEEHVWSLS